MFSSVQSALASLLQQVLVSKFLKLLVFVFRSITPYHSHKGKMAVDLNDIEKMEIKNVNSGKVSANEIYVLSTVT